MEIILNIPADLRARLVRGTPDFDPDQIDLAIEVYGDELAARCHLHWPEAEISVDPIGVGPSTLDGQVNDDLVFTETTTLHWFCTTIADLGEC